ncbi:MAG: hypothetical protein C4336_09970, partial [Armatimonadota bacterium]
MLRIILIVLAVAAGLWLLYELEGILLLIILSVFFAYLIAPLVELVRRPFKLAGRERIIPRAVAIAIVYVLIFGSLGFAFYLLLPRIGDQAFIDQAMRQNQAHISAEEFRLFETAGRTGEIACTLCQPIVMNGQIVAYLDLDNFCDKRALGQASVEAAHSFA